MMGVGPRRGYFAKKPSALPFPIPRKRTIRLPRHHCLFSLLSSIPKIPQLSFDLRTRNVRLLLGKRRAQKANNAGKNETPYTAVGDSSSRLLLAEALYTLRGRHVGWLCLIWRVGDVDSGMGVVVGLFLVKMENKGPVSRISPKVTPSRFFAQPRFRLWFLRGASGLEQNWQNYPLLTRHVTVSTCCLLNGP